MIDRKTRKKIEWAFRSYATLRTQAAEYLVDIAESGLTPSYGAVGGSSCAGNPTEVKGIRAAEHTAVLWCKVVENTKKHFEEEYFRTHVKKYEIIELRYFRNKKEIDVCYELNIERETMYRWVKEILNYAFVVAVQLGLLQLNLEV